MGIPASTSTPTSRMSPSASSTASFLSSVMTMDPTLQWAGGALEMENQRVQALKGMETWVDMESLLQKGMATWEGMETWEDMESLLQKGMATWEGMETWEDIVHNFSHSKCLK